MSKPFEAFFIEKGRSVPEMPKGIRILTAAEAAQVNLGPLAQLQGKWKSKDVKPALIASGWNVISVPGPINPPPPPPAKLDGFVLEVIPYTEELTFCPVVTAGNRGPFAADGSTENDQSITGLLYEQIIKSACPGNKPCTQRGFPNGSVIHAERGLFLFVTNFNNNFDIARLSVIPHGNSVLALGQSFVGPPANNQFPGTASTLPTTLNGTPIPGYGDDQFNGEQFNGIFEQKNPNSFLIGELGNQKITNMTTLVFDTKNPNGGILNIPFIAQNINATTLHAIFWIEQIQGQQQLQLQYTQTIGLVFPPTGTLTPVIWPHVTINTLIKIADHCDE